MCGAQPFLPFMYTIFHYFIQNSLTWAHASVTWTQSTSSYTLIKIEFSIMQLFTPRSSKWFSTSGFPARILYAFLRLLMHYKNPSQWIYLNFITPKYTLNEACRYLTLKNEANIHTNSYLQQQIMKPLFIFPSRPLCLIPLSLNTVLNTLFSNTLDTLSSLLVREQVSHPCRTDKIRVLL
jgi:hypothetical protein